MLLVQCPLLADSSRPGSPAVDDRYTPDSSRSGSLR